MTKLEVKLAAALTEPGRCLLICLTLPRVGQRRNREAALGTRPDRPGLRPCPTVSALLLASQLFDRS